MAPSGEGKRKILFVGEAPGKNEDARGEQFVGKAGKELRRILRSLDCNLDECWKTNSIACHPPSNKIDDLYIHSCRPNVTNAIRDLKPSVIVLLGSSAVKSLIPAEREADLGQIARWVGWRIPSHDHQAWICPTYHPSYLLRMKSPVLERLFKQHLKRALAKEGKPIPYEPLELLKKRVEKIHDPRAAKLRLKDLAKKKGLLAFDYESNRLKPDDKKSKIYACSFCFSEREGEEDTFSVLTDDPEVLAAISPILKNPDLKKIASNLKNEERWTRAIMGHGVRGWHFDTMLAAHVLYNRPGITSLKFQAFVRFGIADYNRVVEHYFDAGKDGWNRIHECPKDDLLTYCGLDSLLELRLARVQRREMGLK